MTKRREVLGHSAKSAGRLGRGRDPVVLVRMPQPLIAAIDRWMASPGAGGRMNRHHSRAPHSVSSRSDAIRKLIVKALGRAGQKAMEAAEQGRSNRAWLALDQRYGLDPDKGMTALQSALGDRSRLAAIIDKISRDN
jgi:Arc/MetJ-type ribon-helix-helix transcriptional regulator